VYVIKHSRSMLLMSTPDHRFQR